jgi:hypothetical protein
MTTPHPTLLLRDFDQYNRYAKMPSIGAEMQTIDFVEGQLSSDCKCQGSFWMDSRSFFALARIDGKLIARIGDAVFELSNDITIRVQEKAPDRTIVVLRDGVSWLSMPYEVGVEDAFSSDETPFVEDEDFDFGLLLANISQSEERKRIMLAQP